MTGPEHFAEAERLLDGPDPSAYDFQGSGRDEFERDRADNVACAQVHATLALVAATLDAAEQVNTERIVGYPAEIRNWREVIA